MNMPDSKLSTVAVSLLEKLSKQPSRGNGIVDSTGNKHYSQGNRNGHRDAASDERE